MAKRKTTKFELFINNNYAAETLVSLGVYSTLDEITEAVRDHCIENKIEVTTWLISEDTEGNFWLDIGHPRIRFVYKPIKDQATPEETITIEPLEEPKDVVTAETQDDVWEK
jgi:hypothetical protein